MDLYADDMAISVRGIMGDDIQWKLNSNLENLDIWFADNKLSLTLGKCKYMIFGTRHQVDIIGKIEFKYGNTVLERVEDFKYLGVCLDSHLTFEEHVKYLKGNLYAKIKILEHV